MSPHAAAAALAAALVLAGLVPGQALGHAVLEHTAPHQNGSVSTAPSHVELEFNEPVRASTGALRVYDREGERVDTGAVEVRPWDAKHVAVARRDGLGRGTYTTTYRVITADGHPLSSVIEDD